MLHLIPPPLHRVLYRLADRARRSWWRLRKPHRNSAHIVAFDEAGKVLLVRHSYGRRVWTLPGGGVGRNESPRAAALREFREELACGLVDLRSLGVTKQEESGSRDMKHVFAAGLAGIPVIDRREIVAAQLFDPAALPADRGRNVERWVARAVAVRAESSQQR
jgi:8-oxo-dGTP pyrophosphatase MutT (NUDIX family)